MFTFNSGAFLYINANERFLADWPVFHAHSVYARQRVISLRDALTTCSNKTTPTAAATARRATGEKSNYPASDDNHPSPRVEHPAYVLSALMVTYDMTDDLAEGLLPLERKAWKLREAAVVADGCDSYLSRAGRTDGPSRRLSAIPPTVVTLPPARVAGVTACRRLTV